MYWSARNQNVFANTNYQVNPKLNLFANFIWNDGRGSMGGLHLDANNVSAIPPGFNYAAISELGRFSALNAARLQNVAGASYQLTPKWSLNATYYYERFKDRSPYLLDATGRTTGAEFGLNYTY
jgi:predicted porin